MNKFIRLVAEMRAAQRMYFKFKDRATLVEAKKLETEVDRVIKDFETFEKSQREHVRGEEQRNLFEP